MKKNHAGLCDLPGEILFQILGCLPVVSILRCTAVCKNWNSLIRSSDFISHHRSFSANNSSLFLRRCGEEFSTEEIEEDFTLYSSLSSASSMEISSPFHPVSNYPRLLRVFGSLHGLICLCDNYHIRAYIIYVWNPLIRRFVSLPTPTLTFKNMGNRICLKMPGDPVQPKANLKRVNDLFAVLGFGYDSRRNDYKVVRIVYPLSSKPPPRAEVCALKERCWREVDHDDAETVLKSCDVPQLWSQCFVDGSIYWPATVGSKSDYILAFDVNDEIFSRIEPPKELAGSGLDISISETKVANIMLKIQDRSWVKFCSIPRDYPYHHDQVIVGMWRDEKVWLEKSAEGDLQEWLKLGEEAKLCVNDGKTKEIERLGLTGIGLRGRGASYAGDYTKSLVLLEPEFGPSADTDPETGLSLPRSASSDLEDKHLRWSVKRSHLMQKSFTFV